MKESNLDGRTDSKPIPRRRKYQDAKFSTLLHSRNGTGQLGFTEPNPCTDDATSSVSTKQSTKFDKSYRPYFQIELSNNVDNLNFSGTPKSLKSRQKFPETGFEITKTQSSKPQKNFPSSPADKINQSESRKNGIIKKNSLFEKYLYLGGQNIESDPKHADEEALKGTANVNQGLTTFNRKVAAEVRRKPRSARRHTATGTSGLTLKDIENWILEHNSTSISKDDSAVSFAKTNIVETKRAVTVNSFDWQGERKLDLRTNEKRNSTQSACETERLNTRNSCEQRLTETEITETSFKAAESRIETAESDFKNKQGVHSTNSISQRTEKATLRSGIDHHLNSFLIPRPYKKSNNSNLTVMSRSLRNWHSGEATIKEDEELKSTWNGYEEKQDKHFCDFSSYIQDDDDDFASPFLRQPPSRRQAKYDTFLDLSKLDLDDDENRSSLSSGDAQPTSVSDSETSVSNSWKTEMTESESVVLETSLGNKTEKETEKVDSCNSLSKIKEEPTKENLFSKTTKPFVDEAYVDDKATFNSAATNEIARPSREFAAKLISPLNSESISGYSFQKEANEPFMRLKQEEDILQSREFSNDSESSVSNTTENSMSLEMRESADENLSLETSFKKNTDFTNTAAPSTTKSMSVSETEAVAAKDSSLALDIRSHNSHSDIERNMISDAKTCDTENFSNSFNDFSTINKSASLDRNAFKKKSDSKLVDVHPASVASTVLSESKTSSTEKANVQHKGMKRLFQIAMSTVNCTKPTTKIKDLLNFIETKGIKLNDPRLRNILKRVENEKEKADAPLTVDVMTRLCDPCYKFLRSLFLSQVAIPGFNLFKLRVLRIFESIQELVKNEAKPPTDVDPYSSYNVLMRKLRNDEVLISLSLCTVDGQRCSFGDSDTPHPLNVCSTVFNYGLACRQNGTEAIKHFLGKKAKPPDRTEFMLESSERVWNPFTKSGSILTSSLLFRELAVQSRLSALHSFYRLLIGNEPLCCDNLSYNYKRLYGHEEMGLAYFLSATCRLPKGTSIDLTEFLDFHFQASSSAMTSDACAIAAATLANDGVCPITGDSVMDEVSVKQTLSVMKTCFFDGFGILKSQSNDVVAAWNDEGSLLIIIPGVLGIACFLQCQPLNLVLKIVKTLIKELTENFNFEIYRSLKEKREANARR